MLGKIISAAVGKKIADRTPGLSDGSGILMGVAAASLVRRLGPLGVVAAGTGTWLVSRHLKKKQARQQSAS